MNESLSHRQSLIYLTLIVWLLVLWGGVHVQFCFDGQAPAVSVHMDFLADHHAHDTKDAHIDPDAEPVQSINAKLTKLDLTTFVVAVVFLLLAVVSPHRFALLNSQIHTRKFFLLRPPLRAPPVFPARLTR